jgi:hypothetical protein
VSLLEEDFRRDVLWRSAEGVGFVALFDIEFGEAEVRELEVALLVEQDVFWFQVACEMISLGGTGRRCRSRAGT